MGKISNTTTNGVISSTVLTSVISEVNSLYDWLNQIGYDNSNNGIGIFKYYSSARKRYIKKIQGADDFKVYSAVILHHLTKGKTDHGTIDIELPNVGESIESYWGAITVTIQSDVPAFATVKSRAPGKAKVSITSITQPSSNIPIQINLIAMATDKDADVGIT